MNWLVSRLKERTSQVAIAYALSQAVPVIQGASKWQDIVPAVIACVITVLVPEATAPIAAVAPAPQPEVQTNA